MFKKCAMQNVTTSSRVCIKDVQTNIGMVSNFCQIFFWVVFDQDKHIK